MGAGDKKVCECLVSFLERNGLDYSLKEESYCDHFYIKHGKLHADVSVYSTGNIKIGGPDSPLKKLLEDNKEAICSANFAQLTQPTTDLDKLAKTIKERIP